MGSWGYSFWWSTNPTAISFSSTGRMRLKELRSEFLKTPFFRALYLSSGSLLGGDVEVGHKSLATKRTPFLQARTIFGIYLADIQLIDE